MKPPAFAIALFSATLLIPVMGLADSKTPTIEELWQIIQAQQEEIAALKEQQQNTDKKVTAADEKAEAAVVAVESGATSSSSGGWADRTTLGGYGEMHYNNLNGNGGAEDKEEIDLHRFVLFFGHEFNDDVRFFSEFEIEHALSTGDGSSDGEVEVEQAFVEIDINDQHLARAGVALLPVGILNETHEPPTFYGVERNPVEKNIIPATWWAGGIGLSGQLAPGWSYDAVLHEGLNTSAADKYKPRSGRQKTSRADAMDLAATARLKWTGIPGTEIAGTIQYQSDITQSNEPGAGSAMLYEVHADIERGPFGLRVLYAMWDLDGSDPASIGADEQTGFYIEPSWKISSGLGVFARFNQWDNAAGTSSTSEKQQWDFGVNWWPHEDVVFKADYQIQDNEDGSEQDGFNLGVGYQF
ncbi:MAG: OprO/OprP family phosphate-selective porin [Gammaproteobacteria bacterium]|nr:OprO/OprP family phosphate-selective porin [Gammaproteobacteria bacterium]